MSLRSAQVMEFPAAVSEHSGNRLLCASVEIENLSRYRAACSHPMTTVPLAYSAATAPVRGNTPACGGRL